MVFFIFLLQLYLFLFQFKIIDSKGQLVPVGSQGELCVRGHYTFMGYWKEEQKTAEVLDKTHWYHTG